MERRECKTCCGNGEIITDWERYLHAHEGDCGDEATADCPDCEGIGFTPPPDDEDLLDQLAEAEANAARIRQQIAAGPCREYGHDWKFIGGCNAGCHDDCACSVNVHQCTKCGDCDYGENDEADEIRARFLSTEDFQSEL